MFDFQETLNSAIQHESDGLHALAAFNYWLINFAYEDEEFPYGYTQDIGERGRKGFLKMMKKHKREILTAPEYLQFKEALKESSKYSSYFDIFERVVNSFIRGKSRNKRDTEIKYSDDIFDEMF